MQATFIPSVLYLFKLFWEKAEVPLNFSYASNESHWAPCFGDKTLLSRGPLGRKIFLKSQERADVVGGCWKEQREQWQSLQQGISPVLQTNRLVQHRAAAGGQDWLHTQRDSLELLLDSFPMCILRCLQLVSV